METPKEHNINNVSGGCYPSQTLTSGKNNVKITPHICPKGPDAIPCVHYDFNVGAQLLYYKDGIAHFGYSHMTDKNEKVLEIYGNKTQNG